jgi:diamine N-acetyltransferase
VEIRLRRGSEGDAAILAEFAARTFGETFAAANRPEDMAAYLPQAYGVALQRRELLDPAIDTLLVEIDGTLAAYAQLRWHDAPACVSGASPAEVWRFYVDARWHGRGIARRLMEAVHETASARGARTLWLGVWERNPRAISFYAGCGFRDVGAQDFYVGADRQTDRIMTVAVRDAYAERNRD